MTEDNIKKTNRYQYVRNISYQKSIVLHLTMFVVCLFKVATAAVALRNYSAQELAIRFPTPDI